MFDHVGLEVTDLARSAAFYDAIMHRLGGRRMHESPRAIAYGRTRASLWIVERGTGAPRDPAGGAWGHVALTAVGKAAVDAAYEAGMAAGGTDDGPPGPRPQYGPRYYAAYLCDPDGVRVEVVAGTH